MKRYIVILEDSDEILFSTDDLSEALKSEESVFDSLEECYIA